MSKVAPYGGLPVPTFQEKPVDGALRQLAAPPTGLHYCIDGHPGRRWLTIEDACEAAAVLVQRIRPARSLMVRVAGSEVVVAMLRWEDETVRTVRLDGAA